MAVGFGVDARLWAANMAETASPRCRPTETLIACSKDRLTVFIISTSLNDNVNNSL